MGDLRNINNLDFETQLGCADEGKTFIRVVHKPSGKERMIVGIGKKSSEEIIRQFFKEIKVELVMQTGGVIVYDGTNESLRQVYELRNSAVRVVCPVCNSDLLVALDYETAGRRGVHPGIYCVDHPEHLAERIIPRPSAKLP